MNNENTGRLLDIARQVGATAVSVGILHPRLDNLKWPFPPHLSIFTPPDEDAEDGWPAAWTIARRMGIYEGCGNRGQAQCDTSGLLRGVWELQHGKWVRLA